MSKRNDEDPIDSKVVKKRAKPDTQNRIDGKSETDNNQIQIIFDEFNGVGMYDDDDYDEYDDDDEDDSEYSSTKNEFHTSKSTPQSLTVKNTDKKPKNSKKKTKGRVKIKMEFIQNKIRRYTTFSKRKTGIMKKVRTSCFVLCSFDLEFQMRPILFCFEGIRAFDSYWHTSNALGCQRNRSCIHIRNKKTTTDDN